MIGVIYCENLAPPTRIQNVSLNYYSPVYNRFFFISDGFNQDGFNQNRWF